jgi:DNA-binding NarL/FixJ family response regulator
MSPAWNILIVNGHPITADAYKNNLLSKQKKFDLNLNLFMANNLPTALERIGEFSLEKKCHLLLLDTNVPMDHDRKKPSLIGFCNYIKKESLKTKIIITTSYNDNLRLLNILSKINPDGLLLKTDITCFDLLSAVKNVILGNPYYSTSVIRLLRKRISQKVILDRIDTEILKELSNGSKMVELLKLIPLTKSGIEKRKRRLKSAFQTKSNSDRELVLVAKERGFI